MAHATDRNSSQRLEDLAKVILLAVAKPANTYREPVWLLYGKNLSALNSQAIAHRRYSTHSLKGFFFSFKTCKSLADHHYIHLPTHKSLAGHNCIYLPRTTM